MAVGHSLITHLVGRGLGLGRSLGTGPGPTCGCQSTDGGAADGTDQSHGSRYERYEILIH
ncbi:hypothetical protein ACH4TU_05065 [Streptomyces physcomitrii]|uniref:hypothetical protein n=1 Tax=Streptomyces physcomitrii TaxID=2724184 RepID=UPI0013315893